MSLPISLRVLQRLVLYHVITLCSLTVSHLQGSGSSNAGVAVGVTLAIVILIIIVIIVIVLSLYLYNKKRGFFKISGWTSYKKVHSYTTSIVCSPYHQGDDNIILTMDSPSSPASYDNPLYSGPGEDYMVMLYSNLLCPMMWLFLVV